jgi:Na+-driven multidrug efflux pump
MKWNGILKNTEAKKSVSIATSIAIAILATALTFPTMTTAAFAQSSNDFQDFMES